MFPEVNPGYIQNKLLQNGGDMSTTIDHLLTADPRVLPKRIQENPQPKVPQIGIPQPAGPSMNDSVLVSHIKLQQDFDKSRLELASVNQQYASKLKEKDDQLYQSQTEINDLKLNVNEFQQQMTETIKKYRLLLQERIHQDHLIETLQQQVEKSSGNEDEVKLIETFRQLKQELLEKMEQVQALLETIERKDLIISNLQKEKEGIQIGSQQQNEFEQSQLKLSFKMLKDDFLRLKDYSVEQQKSHMQQLEEKASKIRDLEAEMQTISDSKEELAEETAKKFNFMTLDFKRLESDLSESQTTVNKMEEHLTELQRAHAKQLEENEKQMSEYRDSFLALKATVEDHRQKEHQNKTFISETLTKLADRFRATADGVASSENDIEMRNAVFLNLKIV